MQRRQLNIENLGRYGPMRRIESVVRRHGRGAAMAALRVALGIVYIWFGALKLAGVSTVATLVQATLPWPAPSWFVPSLGAVEIGIGLVFLWGRHLLLLLPLFIAHMAGTFGVLVMAPQLAFVHHDPAQLTFTGEFVVKNLVLLSAGILVALDSAFKQSGPRTVRIIPKETVQSAEPSRPKS